MLDNWVICFLQSNQVDFRKRLDIIWDGAIFCWSHLKTSKCWQSLASWLQRKGASACVLQLIWPTTDSFRLCWELKGPSFELDLHWWQFVQSFDICWMHIWQGWDHITSSLNNRMVLLLLAKAGGGISQHQRYLWCLSGKSLSFMSLLTAPVPPNTSCHKQSAICCLRSYPSAPAQTSSLGFLPQAGSWTSWCCSSSRYWYSCDWSCSGSYLTAGWLRNSFRLIPILRQKKMVQSILRLGLHSTPLWETLQQFLPSLSREWIWSWFSDIAVSTSDPPLGKIEARGAMTLYVSRES